MQTAKVVLFSAFLTVQLAYGQNDFINSYKRIDRQLEKTNALIVKIKNQLNLTKDHHLLETLQIQFDSLVTESDKLKEQRLRIDLSFIKRNPTSKKSLELISTKIWTQQADKYCDTFLFLYNRLQTILKQSELGIQTQKNLINFKNSKINCIAPDFKMKDINGNQVELKSLFTNKYVLLDFWASWCAPCREDFPFTKKLVEKFDTQLNIIAISRDDNIADWQKAINEEEIKAWIHISTKQNDNKILEDYFVWSIPVKILIDKNGKIIGRWRGGGEENRIDLLKTLDSLLLKTQ